MTGAQFGVIVICVVAMAGVLTRPRRWPEAVWACAGAGLLVVTGLLPWRAAAVAIGRGNEVYLFLAGMMLLAESARREGVFDWVAGHAVGWAKGSPRRLFALVYAVGVVVTALLSNDATAVVLTPAVYAAARRAEVDPTPALFACAMVANAASFVLPISNPANLVLYGGEMPALGAWLAAFALPSLMAIVATFALLFLTMRGRLTGTCRDSVAIDPLSGGGRVALAAIISMGGLLIAMSAISAPLGPATFAAGAATVLALGVRRPHHAVCVVRGVSWGVLPLVAGLFVMVVALEQVGLTSDIAGWLAMSQDAGRTAAIAGGGVAMAANMVNNLPAGLIASVALQQSNAPMVVTDAVLIGVDLGPNLSITGSLATILWLSAIRREGLNVDFWSFLKIGVFVMPPALSLAIGARILIG